MRPRLLSRASLLVALLALSLPSGCDGTAGESGSAAGEGSGTDRDGSHTAGEDGAAAGAGAGPGTGAGVRDSAGISIVENAAAGSWGSGEAWRVEDAPLLQIGVVDGARAYQLFRVADAQRLSDGRFVVADGASQELRFYDAQGRHLRSVGGTGEGPGEFRGIAAVRVLPGDTLLVVDGTLRRFSVHDEQGRLLESFPFPGGDGDDDWGAGARFVDRFGDGTLLMVRPPSIQGLAPGTHHQQAEYRRVTRRGETVSDLGLWDDRRWFVIPGVGMMGSLPFGPQGSAAVAHDRIHFGWSGSYEVRTYRSDGTLERIVRKAHTPDPVTPGHRRALLDFALERWSREGMEISQASIDGFEEIPFGETVPPYSSLRVDDEGNLWLLRYDIRNLEVFRSLPGEGAGVMEWDVFSTDGRFLGSVRTPDRTRVTRIGGDFVLGVASDELGVEYVRVHRMVKGPRGL